MATARGIGDGEAWSGPRGNRDLKWGGRGEVGHTATETERCFPRRPDAERRGTGSDNEWNRDTKA